MYVPVYAAKAVASFAEAWIEIPHSELRKIYRFVASFAEAWIEMYMGGSYVCLAEVASFAEAWIEIGNPHYSSRCCYIVSSQR